MGTGTSTPSAPGKLAAKDLERVQRRFTRLAGPNGLVAIEQFQQIPELGANPFTGRILQLFDGDKDGRLSMEEFRKAIEYFGALQNPEEQYRFAFQIYDQDGDGLVSGPDLHATLSSLMGKAYTPTQLEQVVLAMLREYDMDGDNAFSLPEFRQLLDAQDLMNRFSTRV